MLRKLLIVLLSTLVLLGSVYHDAFAKRFGGGRSFGTQRSAFNYNRAASAPLNAMNRATSSASKWGNRLAGFAMGGLLAYLLMGHGLPAAMFSWLLIGVAALLLIQIFRMRRQTSPNTNTNAYAQNNYNQSYQPVSDQPYQSHFASANQGSYPAGFNSEQFLYEAKVSFMRLQAAHDRKDLMDIREFTTPEVYAEIQMDLQQNPNEENQTEVVNLNAKLLDAVDEGQKMLASVYFTGLIRENIADNAQPFNETWHFQKRNGDSRWTLAGIQQNVQ